MDSTFTISKYVYFQVGKGGWPVRIITQNNPNPYVCLFTIQINNEMLPISLQNFENLIWFNGTGIVIQSPVFL